MRKAALLLLVGFLLAAIPAAAAEGGGIPPKLASYLANVDKNIPGFDRLPSWLSSGIQKMAGDMTGPDGENQWNGPWGYNASIDGGGITAGTDKDEIGGMLPPFSSNGPWGSASQDELGGMLPPISIRATKNILAKWPNCYPLYLIARGANYAANDGNTDDFDKGLVDGAKHWDNDTQLRAYIRANLKSLGENVFPDKTTGENVFPDKTPGEKTPPWLMPNWVVNGLFLPSKDNVQQMPSDDLMGDWWLGDWW